MSRTEPAELKGYIDEQLRTGQFPSREKALDWLHAELRAAAANLDAGGGTRLTAELIEDIKRRGRQRLASLQRRAS